MDILGYEFNGIVQDHVVYRLNKKPSALTNYRYLIVSERIDDVSSPWLDIFIVRDFNRVEKVLKRNLKKKIGLEVTLSGLRNADGLQIGKWFNQIRELYKFCESSSCQFILSSGANSLLEMISGRSFDAILKICDIKPERYWLELEEWLANRNERRCFLTA